MERNGISWINLGYTFFLKMETAETIAEGLQPNYHDKTDQSGFKKTYFSLKKRLSLWHETLCSFMESPLLKFHSTISKSNFDLHKKYSLQI